MAKITITEALSDINLIKKKIASHQNNIKSVLVRMKHIKDPFESDGGSTQMIKRAKQALTDQQKRLEKIRGAISSANLTHEITVGETTKTIFDWLTWKREISGDHAEFVQSVYQTVRNEQQRIEKSPQVYEDAEGKKHMVELVSNIDISDWLREIEISTEMLEKLDGQLSLKNATIVIDI